MKIGDKVRFVSETGGGVVAGFKGKDIVLVEDEDGFQIPTVITDVVVVESDNYDRVPSQYQATGKSTAKETTPKEKSHSDDPADRPVTFKLPPEERKGGDVLSAYLAFVPIDIREVTNTRFETYIINDSNYYMRYTYMYAEGKAWQMLSSGEIEPNTKLYIDEIGRESLDQLQHVAIQLIAYKKDKPFILKSPVSTQLRIDGTKFYKLHTFQENDFFEQRALVYTIVENDKINRPLAIDPEKVKQEMFHKNDHTTVEKPKVIKPIAPKKNEPVVIDLHAEEILETTSGMEPVDILNYQLAFFRRTLKEFANYKGTKIIFIHGKGDGVLRRAIINELRYKYKSYTYQDASFQEYGYGATQVNIK